NPTLSANALMRGLPMSADEGEDRDKPIPVSERYRKSLVTTLTWSTLSLLTALGSYELDKVSLPLTQLKYSTPWLVIGVFLASFFWFMQFRRSERLLKLASSEFAFNHRSSTLSEALAIIYFA
ncbi:MAG: hypothetical protein KAF27_00985, partial [Porphyrobacter sp.]|nr:hypothetical protein [Porphyrobacter sp.]